MNNPNRIAMILNLLRRKILEAVEAGRASYKGLERDTGVARASIMRFVRGRQSLHLGMADRLAAHFRLQLRPKRMGGRRMDGLLPIIPRSNLFLLRHGHGDDVRFAALFRDAWKRVPLWARRRMLDHWRKDFPGKSLCGGVWRLPRARLRPAGDSGSRLLDPSRDMVSPRIELLHGWCGCRDDDILYPGMSKPRRHPYAAAFARGYLLRFCAPLVDRMPDDIVHDLIAHELAHVYQHAIGLVERFDSEPGPGELEEDADQLMEAWSFRSLEIDEWAATVGLVRRIVCKDLGEWSKLTYGPGSRYYNPPREE